MKRRLRNLILRWLGLDKVLAEYKLRIEDLERHFVTRRDKTGVPTETLADVPPEKRDELRKSRKMAAMSWPQRQRYLEATDGETREARPERLPSLT